MAGKRDCIKPIVVFFIMLIICPGVVYGETILVPDDFGTVSEAVQGAEYRDTILLHEDDTTEKIRSISARGKALTIATEDSPEDSVTACQTHDFESFIDGEIITSDIPGVQISVVGNSCGPSDLPYMRVTDTFFTDTFASNVILIDTGCDFSYEYVRMAFADRQNEVSFDLGPWGGSYTYYISVYNQITGGTRIIYRVVTIPGTGFTGARYPVRLYRATGDIRRVEIEASGGGHEALDNLTFGIDHTPPMVAVSDPVDLDCVCGDDVAFTGVVCDDDGAYDRDRIEYQRIHPDADTDWVLIREYVGQPVCDSASLYTWDTTDPDVLDGVYQLRITAWNECGLTDTDEITLYVDNEFGTLEFNPPASIVGGDICFTGTIQDMFCFDSYKVDYMPVSGGDWKPVDSTTTLYTTPVVNDVFATWEYPAGTPDGEYFIRVSAETRCGASEVVTRTMTLDNTPPIAEFIAPESCTNPDSDVITFTGIAYDDNIHQWILERWDISNETWVEINSGNSSVKEGLLGTWNRGTAPACPDVIRLRVWDKARVNPCTAFGDDRHLSEDYIVLKSESNSCPGDFDGDGIIDGSDLSDFASAFGGSCE